MSARADNVSWKTHEALAAVKDSGQRHSLLEQAAAEGWTVREAKGAAAQRKNARAVGAPMAGDGTCTVADLRRLVERGLSAI